MVVLRSREIPAPSPTPKPSTTTTTTTEPATPAQTRETALPLLSPDSISVSGSTCRRSLRLASKSSPDYTNTRKTSKTVPATPTPTSEINLGFNNGNEGDAVGNRNSNNNLSTVLSVEFEEMDNGNAAKRAKGKGILIQEEKSRVVVVVNNENEILEGNQSSNNRGDACASNSKSKRKRSYSKEEKGKGKLVADNNAPISDSNEENKKTIKTTMEQLCRIAGDIASQLADFHNKEDVEPEEEDHLSPRVDVEMPNVEEEEESKIEDWPGPFSTAMKIIRDRANKLNTSLQQGVSHPEKMKPVQINWVPRSYNGINRLKGLLPSLQELCLRILVKNADALTSLESVPDVLRHRLCHSLCDSRRMNGHFLDLLVRGSPTEIRVRDCSWLSEEEFVKHFEGCDTSNLMVLQLDQCGRCLPDYVLFATLARLSSSLPALTTLSLSGACQLSDVGLSSIVSSAPALRSINLSQCSLLTPSSIDTLADSLGSVLRELYINDCQNIDAMLILPALKRLECLQVLSVAGIQTVCDGFMREFIVAHGQNIKELVLADCVELTDSSLKVIAETCSGLCALDLTNLRKLTNSVLGCLANGCREIQTLKLCRNAFSDEAIAAYVETSGELLKELSLNNVKKVGHNTALSLARRSRKLQNLDLSWCRNLTDEAVGLIVDSCLSLKVLKLFGCGQITNVFLHGHSNPEVHIIGLKMSPVLEPLRVLDSEEFPLHYSSVPSSM